MWNPASPIVIAGQTLSDEEVWGHEFRDELYEQCEGPIDGDVLAMSCDAIFSRVFNDNPRHIERLVRTLLMFDRRKLVKGPRSARAHLLRTAAPRTSAGTTLTVMLSRLCFT